MKFIKEFLIFIKHIYANKRVLITLAKNDFEKAYLGSYLGSFWAFLRPLLFVFVIWFVFSVGFRTPSISSEVPFVLWLLTGIVPWFFISETLSSGTNSVVSNKYLLKKISFRASTLPLVKIFSNLIVHFIFILILIILFAFSEKGLSIYLLQMPYYLFISIAFLLGVTWLTSSLRVFIKDITQLISVFLQLSFWLTPIFWSIKLIPEKYRFVIEMNPFYYIVDGYRDIFINHIWFWEKSSTLFYLSITIVFLILGARIFQKLRPHFMDVL